MTAHMLQQIPWSQVLPIQAQLAMGMWQAPRCPQSALLWHSGTRTHNSVLLVPSRTRSWGFLSLHRYELGLFQCKHDRFSSQFATAESAAPGSATTGSRDVSDAADIHATQRFVQWSAVLPRFCSRASPTKRSWLLSPFYHWSDNDVLNRISSVVSSSFIHADLAARLF